MYMKMLCKIFSSVWHKKKKKSKNLKHFFLLTSKKYIETGEWVKRLNLLIQVQNNEYTLIIIV